MNKIEKKLQNLYEVISDIKEGKLKNLLINRFDFLEREINLHSVNYERANILLMQVIETDQEGNKLNSNEYIEGKINKYFQ